MSSSVELPSIKKTPQPLHRNKSHFTAHNSDDNNNVIDNEDAKGKTNGNAYHDDNSVTDSAQSIGSSSNNNNKLNSIMLATIVFYSVSGGPFGIEETVRAGGHFYTLLGFLIMPFVWSIPEAIMTTELGSAFVDASGGVAWVEHAFGHGPGFMVGYLGWIAGATDNGIYPVLFLDYVLQGFMFKHSSNDVTDTTATTEPNLNPVLRFCLLTGTSLVLSYINWLGLPIVGRMSVIICCVAMSPFLLLTIIGIFQVDPNRWWTRPNEIDPSTMNDDPTTSTAGGFFPHFVVGNVLWRPFLNNIFWNLNSFDSAASFSEDVENPGVAYPYAMKWAVLMVYFGYMFPLIVALGASDAKQSDWVDGYLATVISDVVGPWLGDWTVFAAGISNIALYQAELSTEAYQLMGMAERGYVPSIFAKRSRHGTPTYAIMLGTLVVIILVTFSDFSQLLEMLNFNYAIVLLMEYCAFIKLRITHPDMPRPWRLPFNTIGCILLFTPPVICTIFLLSLATYQTYVFCIAVNAIGILLYVSRQRGYWGNTTTTMTPNVQPPQNLGSYNLVHPNSEMNHHATNGMVLSDSVDNNKLDLELS
jgi:amino acid transporter